MDELERELKAGFLEEAGQLLEDTEQYFLRIEESPDDPEIINTLFRLAHNLKGSAKAVGFEELGNFTHKLESLLLKIKNGEAHADSSSVTLLLDCKDRIQKMLDLYRSDLDAKCDCSDLVARLEDAIEGKGKVTPPLMTEAPEVEVEVAPELTEEFVSAPAEGFSIPDASMFPEEPLTSAQAVTADETAVAPETIASEPPISDLRREVVEEAPRAPAAEAKASPPSGGAGTDESVRVSLARLDKLINYVGEMVILQAVLFEQAYMGNLTQVRKSVHQLGKVSKEIQDISMSLRMVPVKQTFQKMQRIVRDTSRILNKQVQLHLEGEETELEKSVLEHLGDPLVHLVRNAVDHGIDSAEDRRAKGKPEQGKIALRAFHHSDNIVIEVQDDGKGINGDVLRRKAVERGILKPDQVITDKAAVHLIFHPGFSTKAEVTDISGRGVGLDVVKTNIERLQGTVDVTTEIGKGTKFRIQLPLTLAIIDATTVKIEDQRFAIPMSHIHESVQLKGSDLHKTSGLGEVFHYRGENLPVYRLGRVLGIKESASEGQEILLIVRTEERSFGVLVKDISSMQQIVIKKLGPELNHLHGISGSAILGDGKPALILDLPALIRKQSGAKGLERMAS